MARPTRLNDELIDLICEQLRTGKPRRAAAAHCGVGRSLVSEWQKRGGDAIAKSAEGYELTDNEQLYARFAVEAELAWDQGESYLWDEAVTVARAGGKWGVFVTLLERTRREEWSPNARELANKDTGPIEIKLSFDPHEPADVSLTER